MSFSSGEYDFYLIFADVRQHKEIWLQEEWKNVYEPLFRKLIELSPDWANTGLRVLEYAKKEITDQYMSEVKLGRLKWNEKSHDKWTFLPGDNRKFSHFESWTPIWTVCEKRDKAPDVYISIQNEETFGSQVSLQFDVFVVIAVSKVLDVSSKEMVQDISKQMQALRSVYNVRTWGRGKKDEEQLWSFSNWIQDTYSFGAYKKSINLNIHTVPFDKLKFEPYWEIIY